MARILVIDDVDEIREALKEMFELEGYDVSDAPNGKIGLKLFHEKKIDVVITDVLMPEKDGIEMVMKLKQEYPKVNIIVMTGGPVGFLKVAEKYDIKYAFKKPIERKIMLDAVRDLLNE